MKDPSGSAVNVRWDAGSFVIDQALAGARTEIDEVLLEITPHFTAKAGNASLLIVLRPYNTWSVGSLSSVKCSDRCVTVNGRKRILALDRPDFLLTGSGALGDIDLAASPQDSQVACDSGMATLCLGYRIKKGSAPLAFRISLDAAQDIRPGKYDVPAVKKEFDAFVRMRNNEDAPCP